MKRFLILFMLLLFVFSCTTEIIKEEGPTVYQLTSENIAVNTKIFPNNDAILDSLLPSYVISTRSKDTDFEEGIMYVDNAYLTDGIIHTIDLSPIVGSKPALVALMVKVTGGCDNEYYNAKFRPYGINVAWLTATSHLINIDSNNIIYLMTDESGRLEWYSDYAWPVEKSINIEIWALWYSVGISIPK